MTTSLKSLIWLRWQYLLSNKILQFVVVLTPFIDCYLLFTFVKLNGNLDSVLLNFGLNMIYSMTAGTYIALMVSEEKEKKILRTLILSGVRDRDYIISSLLFPVILALISAILFPLLFGITIANWLIYLAIVFFTILIYALLNLAIGLMIKGQARASIVSMVVMMLGLFLPLLSVSVPWAATYSFVGASAAYLANPSAYHLVSASFISLMIWVVLAVILIRIGFKYNHKH